MSLKDEIMKTAAVHLEPVEAFGRTVYVKQLPIGDYARLERKLLAIDSDAGSSEVAIRLVAETMCDENGDRIFSDTEIDAMADLPRIDMMRVNAVAERLNRITEQQVMDTAKN